MPLLSFPGHGGHLLGSASAEGVPWADVKLVCRGGGEEVVVWAHRTMLAAVSPFLKVRVKRDSNKA